MSADCHALATVPAHRELLHTMIVLMAGDDLGSHIAMAYSKNEGLTTPRKEDKRAECIEIRAEALE